MPGGPALTRVTPDAVEVGRAEVTLQLDGARFEPGSRVELDGTPLSSRFVSDSALPERLSVRGCTYFAACRTPTRR